MGRRLRLLDRILYCGFGLVDARLIASPQVPSRLALLGACVILNNLPMSLSDGTFGIINAGRRCR
jgi:hypothetical protein